MASEVSVARENGAVSPINAVSRRTMAFANPNRNLSGEARTRDAIYNRGYSLIYQARENGEFEKESRIQKAMDSMLGKTQTSTRRRRSTFSPKVEKWKWGD